MLFGPKRVKGVREDLSQVQRYRTPETLNPELKALAPTCQVPDLQPSNLKPSKTTSAEHPEP